MTKYLLDTNIILFMAVAPERLSKKTLQLIESPKSELYFSAVSSWEIAIKVSLGKLIIPNDVTLFVPDLIRKLSLTTLNIEVPHTLMVSELKKIHQDPFDHLLIAQAKYENLTLVTADKIFSKYIVNCIIN